MKERFFPDIDIEQENKILNEIIKSSYTIQMQDDDIDVQFEFLSIFGNLGVEYSLLYNIYVNDFKSIFPEDFKKISQDLNYLGDELRLHEFLAYVKYNYKNFDFPNKNVKYLYNKIVTEYITHENYPLNDEIVCYIVNDCSDNLSKFDLSEKDIISSIFYSCINNSTSCLKYLYKNITITIDDTDKDRIIIDSISNCSVFIVKILENKGWNFDNCLSYASKEGNLDIVKYLLSKGIDMNDEYNGNNFSLYYACRYGHAKIVKILIENNANINYDEPLIDVACAEGFEDIVKILIKNGANITGCLKYACMGGNLNLVKYLVEQEKMNVNEEGTLQYACRFNHIDIVEYLIKNNASIDDSHVMLTACKYGHNDIVRLLIDNGGDVNVEFYDGIDLQYPIIFAVENNHLSTVELLIRNNADIHVEGEASLIIACKKGYGDIAKLLIENGANIHIYGEMALIKAAENKHFHIVELLIENGAKKDIAIKAANDSNIGNFLKKLN